MSPHTCQAIKRRKGGRFNTKLTRTAIHKRAAPSVGQAIVKHTVQAFKNAFVVRTLQLGICFVMNWREFKPGL